KLVAPVCYYLIYVHVALRSAARLPHGKREVLGKRAVYDLVCRFTYVPAFFLGHSFWNQLKICPCRRELQYSEGVYDFSRHLFYPYFKVFKAPLRLRSPVSVCGNRDLSERVVLYAIFHIMCAHCLS